MGDGGPEGMMATQEGWRFVTQDIAGEINDIVVNFQHLLNELRPVQARETLRNTMEEQVKRRKEEAALIRRCVSSSTPLRFPYSKECDG